jgi:hypothetical protein
MTRTAAAVAYDSAGNLVLSIGARNAVGEDVVVDTSDVTSVPDSSERTEILRTLRAEGYLVTSAEYADSLAEHAAADVLTELSDSSAANRRECERYPRWADERQDSVGKVHQRQRHPPAGRCAGRLT